ncbi:hypothetical protein ZIOFF_069648 [Zingiber officinale]|uniref:Polygalacturonase n=1 Tax=Zingiber officinale TaxID=94328 RepID=A0A8J5EU88_ZINOF|nr:hypothetical protein ZIOFF_069648 [Zingiber officinale]
MALVFIAELNAMSSTITILLLLALVLCSPADAAFNIADYGAKSDGRTDSSEALLSAWQAACGSTGAATVYVPSGSFLVRRAEFSGPCKSNKIKFQIDGTLVAPSGYGTAGEWLLFDHVEGVTVYGGTIDGRGSSLWACKAAGHGCPAGAYSLVFRNSRGIMISGVTSVNSELYHIVIDNCDGATIQGVRITAPGNSPNTDGIHVQMSSHVTITGAGIRTGDDCISIGPGSTNLWIEQVNCGPGHGIRQAKFNQLRNI